MTLRRLLSLSQSRLSGIIRTGPPVQRALWRQLCWIECVTRHSTVSGPSSNPVKLGLNYQIAGSTSLPTRIIDTSIFYLIFDIFVWVMKQWSVSYEKGSTSFIIGVPRWTDHHFCSWVTYMKKNICRMWRQWDYRNQQYNDLVSGMNEKHQIRNW